MKNKCFIIAEAGVNHNGCIDRALEMIKVAASAGADAIKFQTFTAENLVTQSAKTADYQKNNSGCDNQYQMLKKLELKESDYPRLIEESVKNNIEFMSTPFDEEALDMLVSLGMKRIKVPSGELTNLPFLKKIASKNLPIILSTGMADLHEIEEAVQVINDERKKQGFVDTLTNHLTILHCTSNYPCEPDHANLRAITTIKKQLALPVGYSDHTLGIDIAVVCIGLEVCVYEKHFTLDKTLSGPDHQASLSPPELNEMIKKIRFAERTMGSFEKKPSNSELEIRKIVRKSVAINKDKKAGQPVNAEDIHFLRPGTGIEPKHSDTILGRILKNDAKKNTIIHWDDLD